MKNFQSLGFLLCHKMIKSTIRPNCKVIFLIDYLLCKLFQPKGFLRAGVSPSGNLHMSPVTIEAVRAWAETCHQLMQGEERQGTGAVQT